MLSSQDVVANIAVKDLKRARQFYEEILGLQPMDQQGEEVVTYKSGHSQLFVYRSEFAGNNKATAATWVVDDVEKTVKELKGKGVKFEHYDNLSNLTHKGDFYEGGNMKVAWFKDVDDNILCVAGS